jgi:hypothetical protein
MVNFDGIECSDLYRYVKATQHTISQSRLDLQLRYIVCKLTLTHVSYPFIYS